MKVNRIGRWREGYCSFHEHVQTEPVIVCLSFFGCCCCCCVFKGPHFHIVFRPKKCVKAQSQKSHLGGISLGDF